MSIQRCSWVKHELDIPYHDQEWGVPCYDDAKLFEFLLLEGAQAGLAWITVLKKRDGYRQAFQNFDAEAIARFAPGDVERLMQNPDIIRNRLKIESAITNARQFLNVREQFGNFSDYIWQFVDGVPIQNNWRQMAEVPATSTQSDAMSKELKKRGFKFVGSTICYAYMQAMGMVNDHTTDCHRHHQCKELSPI